MKHLIIFTHPNPNSLNNHIKTHLEAHLKSLDHELRTRDLYELNFNPVLSISDMHGQIQGKASEEVKTEQQYIQWADCLTIIHPIWWTGLPAIYKGYIDRVFSYGFAYRYDEGVQKGLLNNKQAIIINTHGKSHGEYNKSGMSQALSLTSDQGIYKYCGLQVKRHFFFDKADKASVHTIAHWLDEIKTAFSDLEKSTQQP